MRLLDRLHDLRDPGHRAARPGKSEDEDTFSSTAQNGTFMALGTVLYGMELETYDLSNLEGVDPATKKKLEDAGIGTLDLVVRGPVELEEISGMALETCKKIVTDARRQLAELDANTRVWYCVRDLHPAAIRRQDQHMHEAFPTSRFRELHPELNYDDDQIRRTWILEVCWKRINASGLKYEVAQIGNGISMKLHSKMDCVAGASDTRWADIPRELQIQMVLLHKIFLRYETLRKFLDRCRLKLIWKIGFTYPVIDEYGSRA